MPDPAISDSEFSGPVLSQLSTAVLLLDAELRVRALNPAAESLLGTGTRNTRGRLLAGLSPAGLQLAEVAEELGVHTSHVRRGLALEQAGDHHSVDCVASRLDQGILLEVVPLDWHEKMARLEALLQQDQAANALIRGMAHEIKNPLGGLRGAAQLLERRLGDPQLKEYTRVIMDEADRLNDLLTRLGGLDTPTRTRQINVHELVEHVRVLEDAAAPTAVTIQCDYDPSIPLLELDADQMIQALLNLTRNAIQAVGDEGTIVLRTRVVHNHPLGDPAHGLAVAVEVIDDGPGVPDALRDSIFYPMVTGRPGGTGLGLSIAQAIARRHAGLITCESRPGATRFALFLPLHPGVEGEHG
jgi:two-component system nitrogen regulation sensor histidine kinase GlnL